MAIINPGELDLKEESVIKINRTAKVTSRGAFTVTATTEKISTRAKGRQMAVRFSSTGTEDEWLLGDFRVNARKDGMR